MCAGVAGAGRRAAAAAGAAAHGAAGAAVDAAPRARAAAAVPLPGAGRAGGARRAARRHLPLHAEAAAGLRAQPARLHGLHLEPDHTSGPGEHHHHTQSQSDSLGATLFVVQRGSRLDLLWTLTTLFSVPMINFDQ